MMGAVPWPGAWRPTANGPLKILDAEPAIPVDAAPGEPGVIVALDDGDPVVACGHGALALRRVQCPGKKATAGREAVMGRQLQLGSAL